MNFVVAEQTRNTEEVINRKTNTEPFSLPDAGNAKQDHYVTMIKPDSPIECIHIGDITFHKRLYPVEAGYVVNQNKYYDNQIMVQSFTKKQAEAIQKYLSGKVLKVRMHTKFEYNKDGTINEVTIPAKIYFADDLVIFETVQEYQKRSTQFVQNIDEKILEDIKS